MIKKDMSVPPVRGNVKRKRANVIPRASRVTPDETQRMTPDAAQVTPDGASSKPRKRKKQKPRLKITVQNPELLELLSRKLGISKAAVFNSALGLLAVEAGVEDQHEV